MVFWTMEETSFTAWGQLVCAKASTQSSNLKADTQGELGYIYGQLAKQTWLKALGTFFRNGSEKKLESDMSNISRISYTYTYVHVYEYISVDL